MVSRHYSHKAIESQGEAAYTQPLLGRNVEVKMQEEHVEWETVCTFLGKYNLPQSMKHIWQ